MPRSQHTPQGRPSSKPLEPMSIDMAQKSGQPHLNVRTMVTSHFIMTAFSKLNLSMLLPGCTQKVVVQKILGQHDECVASPVVGLSTTVPVRTNMW